MALCGNDFKKCCPRLTKDVVADAVFFLERDGYRTIETVTAYTGRSEIVLEGEDIGSEMRKGAVIRYNSQDGAREEATISFPAIYQIQDKDANGVRLCHDKEDAIQYLSKFVLDKRDHLGPFEEVWVDAKRSVMDFFNFS
jgi:hypothetical protein